MPRKQPTDADAVLQKLDTITSVLQDLFIMQAKLAGMNKGRVRAIVGVADARVSRVWREVGSNKQD